MKSRHSLVPFAMIAALACSLCGCSTQLSAASPALSDPSKVDSIRIERGWNGLNLLSPVQALYELRLIGSSFEGSVEFRIGYLYDFESASALPLKHVTKPISISRDIVSSFLEVLSTTPLQYGDYTPSMTVMDAYPTLMIDIDVSGNHAVFYSASQGEGMAPWKVSVDRQDYVVFASTPADAFKVLRPYLKEDVFRALLDESLSPWP